MPIDPGLKRDLQEKAVQVRKLILEAVHHAGAGHIGGPLSMVEIAVALYFKMLRVDPKNPQWPDRDRFVLSNGRSGGHWKDVTKGFRMRDETMKTRNAAARFRVPRWILTLPERSTSRSGKAKAPF